MKRLALKELISEGAFKYNRKESPANNYRLFQQAISFERGVEFLSSSNDHAGPIIYLIKVPSLSTDLKQTKRLLDKFNKDLLDHFSFYIRDRKDIFKVHEIYLDLCNAVLIQQQEYHYGKEKYFGIVTVKEYSYKEIKELKLPIIRSTYRGTFLNTMNLPSHPVEYKKLGSETKKFLTSLYLLKRKANVQLLKELDTLKRTLFYKEQVVERYQYKGEIADVIEFALALKATGNLHSLNNAELDANKFCSDLCKLLGVPFSKLSNHLPTITKRKVEEKLFLDKAKKLLKSSPEL